MAGSEFAIKQDENTAQFALFEWFRHVVVVMVYWCRGYFLDTLWASLYQLSIVETIYLIFITTVYSSSDGRFHNRPCHKAQSMTVSSAQMATTVTKSNSPQVCSNGVMLSCQHQNLRNVSSSLLNLCHNELKVWRQKVVQPTSKLYLIEWLIILCISPWTQCNSSWNWYEIQASLT